MKWVITGGCGFVGLNLIKSLLGDGGNAIRIVDNLSAGTKADLKCITNYTETAAADIAEFKGVELIVGDILDAELACRVAQGADVIIHLAANTGVGPSVENPRSDLLANVLGTFNYLEAARLNKVGRFVFASSGAPAGAVEPPIHEEVPPHPVSPYGASKLSGEGYCSAYFYSYNVPTVVLRFGNVYGPGSIHKQSIIAKLIKRAMNGEVIEIYGDGAQTRDFIFIDDLVGAVKLAVSTSGIGGEVFQIATSQETTVSEITGSLVEIMKKHGYPDVEVVNAEVRVGDVKRNFSDTSKARTRLGWVPTTRPRVGLENTVLSFLQ